MIQFKFDIYIVGTVVKEALGSKKIFKNQIKSIWIFFILPPEGSQSIDMGPIWWQDEKYCHSVLFYLKPFSKLKSHFCNGPHIIPFLSYSPWRLNLRWLLKRTNVFDNFSCFSNIFQGFNSVNFNNFFNFKVLMRSLLTYS